MAALGPVVKLTIFFFILHFPRFVGVFRKMFEATQSSKVMNQW